MLLEDNSRSGQIVKRSDSDLDERSNLAQSVARRKAPICSSLLTTHSFLTSRLLVNMVATHPRRPRSLLSSLLLVSSLSVAVAASASPAFENTALGVFDLTNSDFDDPLDPRNSFEESAPFEVYGDASSVWHHHGKRALGKAWTGTTKLAQAGTSGVGAM